MDNICDKNYCTGCSACVNICPKKAISMEEQTIGHIYPVIDEEKCIDCGLCNKICPVNSKPMRNIPKDCYAAWAKDETEHKTSTSGGAAAAFTNFILNKSGAVYGSVFEGKIKHKRITDKQTALKLKGSKYVQSHIEDTYSQAKKDLENGLKVLFIGMPCQIAGLKAFLGRTEYPNLITVDMICHGVPSQKILFEHLESKGLKKEDIETVSFRDAEGFIIKAVSSNGKIYKKSFFEDLYYMAFNSNLIFRESCYNCEYANSERVGDITIGDFWGLGKQTPFEPKVKNGISVILTNTQKGQEFLDECKESLNLIKRTVSEAIEGNGNLRYPSSNDKHYYFIEKYKKSGLKKAFKKSMLKKRVKSFVLKYYLALRKKL